MGKLLFTNVLRSLLAEFSIALLGVVALSHAVFVACPYDKTIFSFDQNGR